MREGQGNKLIITTRNGSRSLSMRPPRFPRRGAQCREPFWAALPQTACWKCSGAGNIRARMSSAPARPYIARLRVFKRLICPSVWPLLQHSVSAFLTASISCRSVRTKHCIA